MSQNLVSLQLPVIAVADIDKATRGKGGQFRFEMNLFPPEWNRFRF